MVKCESWTENTKANSFGRFCGNLSLFLYRKLSSIMRRYVVTTAQQSLWGQQDSD